MQFDNVTAVVLAGGRARRMQGRDKGLEILHGEPMIGHVIRALRPQVGRIVVNANRNQAEYLKLGHPVVADTLEDFQGPLAGLLAGMREADSEWVMSCPCDTPQPPAQLAGRLLAAATTEAAEIVAAHDGRRLQPVFVLVRRDLANDLAAFLQTGERKVVKWFQTRKFAQVDFSDCATAFANINTAEELSEFSAGHKAK